MRPLLLRPANHQATGLLVLPGDLIQLMGQLVEQQARDLLPAQHGRVHRPYRLVHVPPDRGHLLGQFRDLARLRRLDVVDARCVGSGPIDLPAAA